MLGLFSTVNPDKLKELKNDFFFIKVNKIENHMFLEVKYLYYMLHVHFNYSLIKSFH